MEFIIMGALVVFIVLGAAISWAVWKRYIREPTDEELVDAAVRKHFQDIKEDKARLVNEKRLNEINVMVRQKVSKLERLSAEDRERHLKKGKR